VVYPEKAAGNAHGIDRRRQSAVEKEWGLVRDVSICHECGVIETFRGIVTVLEEASLLYREKKREVLIVLDHR
jgi:hypothetical protein